MNIEDKIRVIKILLNKSGVCRLSVLVDLASLNKDTDLAGVVLSRIKSDGPDDLSYFNFSNSDLSNSDLRHCDLTGANFTDANLTNTDLEGCTLINTVFKNTILRNTNFKDTVF
jgi:uncharacterized protein YjbI with pentapeptide repeats